MTHRERAIDQIAGIITDHMQAAIQFECEDSPLGWSAWLESKRAEVQEQNDGDGFTFDAIFGDEGPNSWTRVQRCEPERGRPRYGLAARPRLGAGLTRTDNRVPRPCWNTRRGRRRQ